MKCCVHLTVLISFDISLCLYIFRIVFLFCFRFFLQSHFINKIFVCTGYASYSNRMYISPTQSNQQKRSRSGRSLHCCRFCSYSTYNKYDVTKHELIHTGERPHKCMDCGKTFSRKETLSRHRLIHISNLSLL